MEPDATGNIAVVIQRRKGDITVPIYLWLGGQWVDVATLTAQQFNSWVNNRLAYTAAWTDTPPIDNLTISRTPSWP
jgi:hypothetical protein